jgi:hypothetical protein
MAAKHSSINIKLSVNGENVAGLTDIPDMGATPEKLDVTTLADDVRKYINGVKDFGDLEFTFIYESGADGNYKQLYDIIYDAQGNKIEANEAGETACIVEFPDGSKFEFNGTIDVRIIGVGVNAVITFAMTVALASDINYKPAQA